MTLIKSKATRFLGLVLLGTFLVVRQGIALDDTPNLTVLRDLSYGDPVATVQAAQTLDLYRRAEKGLKQPVVVYVHGGGWAFGDKDEVDNKAEFFTLHGLAFISMNYRLRWDYTIFDQLTDVASVIKWVSLNAGTYDFDASKIILMGSGSGAHLVSLVGTDERYLETAGLSFANIVSVVAIEGEAYDLQRNIDETASFITARHLKLIFGDNPEVWKAASPVTYVTPDKNIPAFALMYMPDEEAAAMQANLFAKALSEAKVETIIMPGDPDASTSIDETLGTPGNGPSLALVTFIKAKI